MKKIFYILFAVLLIITVLAGCSGKGKTMHTSNSNVPSSGKKENKPLNSIVLTDKIIEFTNGFSAVRNSGDYRFDLFLEKGGASSDSEVVSFLMEIVFYIWRTVRLGGESPRHI